jgi:hypothetical protein
MWIKYLPTKKIIIQLLLSEVGKMFAELSAKSYVAVINDSKSLVVKLME